MSNNRLSPIKTPVVLEKRDVLIEREEVDIE